MYLLNADADRLSRRIHDEVRGSDDGEAVCAGNDRTFRD